MHPNMCITLIHVDNGRRPDNDGFVNQPDGIDDQPRDAAREWIDAAAAADLLGVKRETLYAYVSRGLVRSAVAPRSEAGARASVYHVADLERLKTRSRARSGHGAVAASALRWGEPVLETAIGAIREDGPYYRGRSAVGLARAGTPFEAICDLLWGTPRSAAPTTPPKGRGRGGSSPDLGVRPAAMRALLARDAEPFDAMLLVAATLAAAEPHTEITVPLAREKAPALVRRMIAAAGLVGKGDASSASLAAPNAAEAMLIALGGAARGRASSAHVAAMNEALALAADHELNPSAFAARIAASAGASLMPCIVAALATLSGPLHGGATARVAAFAAEVAKPERAASAIAARLDRGESIPGFGHPLYPKGDPRGARLVEVAESLGGKSKSVGVRLYRAIIDAMHLVSRERPTIDVGLCMLASALGLRSGSALAIFASGRVAGFVAHALEQREAGFILRPRARYVGE